jgi:hypothetical protein
MAPPASISTHSTAPKRPSKPSPNSKGVRPLFGESERGLRAG